METKPATPARKGSIIALALIILSVVIYFTNQYGNRNLRYLQYAIVFVGILLSSMYYAKQMDGNITFGNVFAEGFKTTAVVIVLLAIYTIISLKLVFPGMVDKMVDAARQEAQSQGQASLDEFNKSAVTMKEFMVPITIGFTIVSIGVSGAVAALAGAAFSNKKSK